MRSMFALILLGMLMQFVSDVHGGEEGGGRSTSRPRKYAGTENDPVFQALDALQNSRLRDEISAAAEAYYSSRFTVAHKRISAIMGKYPEAAIGGVLYDFLLLMDGAALGFSGEHGQAIETLNRLQTRMENEQDDAGADNLAGVMSLKIDILELDGDSAAAVSEMDVLIARFGDSDLPNVRWRVEGTLQRKAALLEKNGTREQAIAAYRAFVERLQAVGELDNTRQKRLELALRKLQELEREAGHGGGADEGQEVLP